MLAHKSQSKKKKTYLRTTPTITVFSETFDDRIDLLKKQILNEFETIL